MQYKYIIKFEGGDEKVIDIQLDADTLTLQSPNSPNPPEWALLDQGKCALCPLDSAGHKYCPIALSLSNIIRDFSDKASTMLVDARVITREREYSKRTSLQSVLSSIIGIHMVTSGCPVMNILKPMAAYHLPFASLSETVYRSVSSYLLQQYLRKKKGLDPDWELNKLTKAYEDIEKLNQGIVDRVRKGSSLDANYNAVIILDVFAKMVPRTIDQSLPSKGFQLPD
ncbi:MAG TPA: hypothetical protein DCZ92_02440 [Elusimicrobia bacterium]|nr:MAG: hypothetical protein A2016_00320 [Elusimicrobia bacterium GWF2_62_30]HBA59683.1 hypothetical protein [Elusimicrobiota bacterium]